MERKGCGHRGEREPSDDAGVAVVEAVDVLGEDGLAREEAEEALQVDGTGASRRGLHVLENLVRSHGALAGRGGRVRGEDVWDIELQDDAQRCRNHPAQVDVDDRPHRIIICIHIHSKFVRISPGLNVLMAA